jgi:hypothetical protein
MVHSLLLLILYFDFVFHFLKFNQIARVQKVLNLHLDLQLKLLDLSLVLIKKIPYLSHYPSKVMFYNCHILFLMMLLNSLLLELKLSDLILNFNNLNIIL